MIRINKKDKQFLLVLFLTLMLVIGLNIRISLRRGRDNIRKNDVSAIQGALVNYQEKYKVFPESRDGKIIGCLGSDSYFDESLERYVNLRVCEWGIDSFESLKTLPRDPNADTGRSYLYISNERRFQLFTSLEGTSESEYTQAVVLRDLKCGNAICNYGKSYGALKPEMSIEEFERLENN